MRVCAIAVAASGPIPEDFREIMPHFTALEFECAESFYSRGVYNLCPFRQARDSEHFGKCSGVHTGVVYG